MTSNALKVEDVLDCFGSTARVNEYRYKMGRLVGLYVDSYVPLPVSLDFAILHMILAGADEATRNELMITKDHKYKFLTVQCPPNLSFEDLRSRLKSLGINSKVFKSMLQVLAAILNLGELDFTPLSSRQSSECRVTSTAALEAVATLLGISEDALENMLTSSTKYFGKEKFSVNSTPEQALQNSFRFARVLYTSLYHWFISHLNTRLSSDGNIVRTITTTQSQEHNLHSFLCNASADFIFDSACHIMIKKYEDAMEDNAVAHVYLTNPFSDAGVHH
jgi:Myosin head (motor domain)